MELNFSELGWNTTCQKECYGPDSHSHDFISKNDQKKICKQCSNEMISTQLYRNNFGRAELELINFYNCDSCSNDAFEVLYRGPQITFKELKKFVLRE